MSERTLVEVNQGKNIQISASLPAPNHEQQIQGLGRLLEGLGQWLEEDLDVVLHVSAGAPLWWECLDAPNGLPTIGMFYDCTIVVDEYDLGECIDEVLV